MSLGQRDTVVSIHAPVWGANNLPSISVTANGFNPRTRVGCELEPKPVPMPMPVSIHAPVWGAKPNPTASEPTKTVSIHAPVWGANRQG